jgi:hypothetical protein
MVAEKQIMYTAPSFQDHFMSVIPHQLFGWRKKSVAPENGGMGL